MPDEIKNQDPEIEKRDENPRMLYAYPGENTKLQDGFYDTVIVKEYQVAEYLKAGWFKTPGEAKKNSKKK